MSSSLQLGFALLTSTSLCYVIGYSCARQDAKSRLIKAKANVYSQAVDVAFMSIGTTNGIYDT